MAKPKARGTRTPATVNSDAARQAHEAALKSFDVLMFPIKATLTVNGGAAIALIALINAVVRDQPALSIGFDIRLLGSLIYFWGGIITALLAGAGAYLHLRLYGQAAGRRWIQLSEWFTQAALTLSGFAFMYATLKVTDAFVELINAYSKAPS